MKQKLLNCSLYDNFEALQTISQGSIDFKQFEYYRKISKELSDPFTSPKLYYNL